MSGEIKEIVIDIRRLKMRDYALIQRTEEPSITELISLLARISNYTEDELLDLEIDEFNDVQNRLTDAVNNIVKKTTAGN